MDIVERLRFDAARCEVTFSKGVASNIEAAAGEIERLRALLKHADDVVIWEHTPARTGFQEEIEDALGIANEQ